MRTTHRLFATDPAPHLFLDNRQNLTRTQLPNPVTNSALPMHHRTNLSRDLIRHQLMGLDARMPVGANAIALVLVR